MFGRLRNKDRAGMAFRTKRIVAKGGGIMDFLRAFIGVTVIIAVAVLLGRLDHKKHPEAYVYGWITSIAVLLTLGFCL
jgi:hypothetical protein